MNSEPLKKIDTDEQVKKQEMTKMSQVVWMVKCIIVPKIEWTLGLSVKSGKAKKTQTIRLV